MAALHYFCNNFQDEPREFAVLGVLAPCEFAECAWSSPGKRMRARSNELTVKSCMPQRNWGGRGWRTESWCRWGERCTFFFENSKFLQGCPDCPTGLGLFQLESHKPAAALEGFSNGQTYRLALTCCFSSFICSLFFRFSSAAIIAAWQHMKWLFHYSVKGSRLFWARGWCLPCCLRASLAACSMACFSSFLINLSWAACRAISATWWNTLRPLQVVLRGQSADIHMLQTNWSK